MGMMLITKGLMNWLKEEVIIVRSHDEDVAYFERKSGGKERL